MRLSPSYRLYEEGDWKLWALPQHWNAIVWRTVQDRIAAQSPAKHPQTIRLDLPESQGQQVFYLKVFHGASGAGALKDVFRSSKALSALRQGAKLSELGFNLPLALAAGELRRYRLLLRSFLLSRGVAGQALPLYLCNRCDADTTMPSLREKRNAIDRLAAEIRRFHSLGFVHGDLVPTNVFVSTAAEGGIRFYLMDNDRTGRYPAWIPQRRWRRNLVQLNRLPLAGITLQDRMRFLRRYLLKEKWAAEDRPLISWLERKTRQRRWVCDHVQGAASFRELMRWNGPFNQAPASILSSKP
jgi:hypothetical protein